VKKLLLDSGILSDFINRRRSVYDRVKEIATQRVRIGTCIPVIAEIVFGIEASKSREQNMQRFQSALPSLVVWPFDYEAAYRYGNIAAELRRIGRPMQVVDIMVGAIALNLGDCTVVTTDSDLLSVPGLSVELW
jgi:tRNA(fMet)-specific endonuclease VapC